MDNQTLIKTLEDLKNAGFIYNDADFCRKVGLSRSHVSEIRQGKKPFTALTLQRMRDTFPSFFAPEADSEQQRTTSSGDAALMTALAEIGEQRKLVSQSQCLIAKNQEQIDRLLLIIEKLT